MSFEVDSCSLLWCDAVCSPGSFADFMWFPIIAHCCWVLFHSSVIHVIFKDYIKRNNKKHFYRDSIENPTPVVQMFSKFYRMVGLNPEAVPVFYANCFLLNTSFLTISWFFWQSFALHTAWLLSLISYVCYNGATFNFQMFSVYKFTKQLQNVFLKICFTIVWWIFIFCIQVRYACEKFKAIGYRGVAFDTHEKIPTKKEN